MKKLILLFFMAFYGFTTSNAQDRDFIAFTGGFLNASSKSIDELDVINKSSDIGFYAGFLAEVYISYEIWFQPELIYARADETNYIQLPLPVKFYISN